MSLKRLEMEVSGRQPPPPILAFLEDARKRFTAWSHTATRVPALVNSNFWLAHELLERARPLAVGERFCEWGSGSGVVTCLAGLLGYRAVGLEINEPLVEFSRDLAQRHQVPVSFFLGSYIPEGTHTDTIHPEQLAMDCGFSPFDFDVMYVYPWPAEEETVMRLFDRFAPPEALLIVYRGGADMRLYARNDHGPEDS